MIPSRASADTTVGEAAFVGSGTITPGLTTVPTSQSISFSGTMVGGSLLDLVDDNGRELNKGMFGCLAYGNSSTAETVLQGQGVVGLNCTEVVGMHLNVSATPSHDLTPSGSMTCGGLGYTRVGPVVVLDPGPCNYSTTSDGGTTNGTATTTGVFLAVGTTLPPVTSYQIAGFLHGTPIPY